MRHDILLASLLLGSGFQLPNDVRVLNDEYQYDAEVLAEYELIKEKKSRLSRSQRDIIERKALRIIARNKMP